MTTAAPDGARTIRWRRRSVLPGFGLSLGYTIAYLSLVVLIPLAAVFLKAGSLGFEHFWQAATSPRVLASYRLSFGASLLAAIAVPPQRLDAVAAP